MDKTILHVHSGVLLSHSENEIMEFTRKWVELEREKKRPDCRWTVGRKQIRQTALQGSHSISKTIAEQDDMRSGKWEVPTRHQLTQSSHLPSGSP